MPRVVFNLSGPSEGLRVKRFRQAGRLVLDKVINDGDPYWFVTIRKFNQTLDRKLVGSLKTTPIRGSEILTTTMGRTDTKGRVSRSEGSTITTTTRGTTIPARESGISITGTTTVLVVSRQ